MGRAAHGTLLRYGDGAATEVFATLSEVRDISGGLETLDTEDVTHQASTMEEVVGTILRGNEVTFQVNHNPRNAGHAALRTDQQNKTLRNFKLAIPGATATGDFDILAFPAIVTTMSPSYAVAGALVSDVGLKPSTTLAAYTTATSATG